MTPRHGWLLISIIGAVVVLACLRLIPGSPSSATPCLKPMGIERGGEITIVCERAARVPGCVLLAAVGLTECPARMWIQRGEMVRIGTGGRFTRAPLPGAVLLVLGIPLDLNHASLSELILLPSIGPVLAARIVKDRHERGSFGSLQELQRVRGIGPRTFKRLRPLLTVSVRR